MIRLPATVAALAALLVPTAAAADEPVVSAGRTSYVIAIDHDGDRVVFDSSTRNIDPLVDPRHPHGTYRWTPSSLGRVEPLGSIAIDITADGTTTAMVERVFDIETAPPQAWVFATDDNRGRELVSVSSSGEPANGNVYGVAIADDARHVAFVSTATNIDGDGASGVFLRDRATDTTRRVATIGPNGGFPVLDQDASTVAYTDYLTVFARDLPDGEVEVVDEDGTGPELSADGDVVAWTDYDIEAESAAVVVLDRRTGTELARVADAFGASISDDGTRVAYTLMRHSGTNEQTLPHVYVLDLRTGTTTLADRTPDGQPGDLGSIGAQLSGDGRKVVYQSVAGDLVPGVVTARTEDLYLTDLETGAVQLLTVGRDGGIQQLRTDGFADAYGAAQPRTPQPRLDGAVAIASPPFWDGFWVANAAGRVGRAGLAQHHGEVTTPLARPIVDMASSRSGQGYWLVASDGGVFSFGDARFHGSTGAIRLNQPIVGMAPTPSGRGYWLVAADGGIFSFGDARFHGSTGAMRLNQPIVGMARTRTGNGYWLVARDGGIFAFGDARFLGSTGAIRLNQPVIAMVRTFSGSGYRLVARDGGVFAFGDATHHWGPSDPRCGAVCIVDAASA